MTPDTWQVKAPVFAPGQVSACGAAPWYVRVRLIEKRAVLRSDV
jgi:hypothetical protein